MSLNGGYAMRTFDLTPFYRSTVGFDRLFNLLDQAGGVDAAPGYPPYNIERTGENAYRISVAVAGFSEPELNIELKENTLTVKGEKQTKTDERTGEVLYQGIAARAFERVFQLADFVQVKGAALENGLLHVDLVREIPEAKKPRQIAINGGNGKVIEGQTQTTVETKVAA
jgi:molecular chaperone IbpA